jgi:hypothetical protein
MPFESHEVTRRHLVFSKHDKFPAKNSVWRRSPVWNWRRHRCHWACALYLVSNISKIGALNPILILFIFAFHILFDPTTIATQQFLPAEHFKINKNIKYEVFTSQFIKICSSAEHRENPKLSNPLSCIQHWMSVLFSFSCSELTSCINIVVKPQNRKV